MTTLHDRLSALADAVEVPPAPALADLADAAGAARDWRPWVAAAAAAAVVTTGAVVWQTYGDDRGLEPAPQPVRWSDLDVPWTEDETLHWRGVELPAADLTGYALSRDALYLLADRTLTEVRPDGTVTELATGVTGPVVADPDGSVVAWAAGQRLTAYDGTDGTRATDPERSPERMPVSVSGTTVFALGEEGGYELTLRADGSLTSAAHSEGEATVDARAGWQVVFAEDGPLVATSDAGRSVSLGRRQLAPGISPTGDHLVSAGPEDALFMTGLATGETAPVALPSGARLADFGWRWADAESLVVPTLTEADTPEAQDPEVTWLVCRAPDWACEPMDVPTQPRSEIAVQTSAWNYMMVGDTTSTTSSGSDSATSSLEPPSP